MRWCAWRTSGERDAGSYCWLRRYLSSGLLVYFGLTGAFHTKFLRYMLPVTPLLCLWGAALLMALMRQRRAVWRASR